MDRVTVALVHNYYQHPGGEDVVFHAEADLLERCGHRVLRYTLDNAAIARTPRVALARATVWNGDAYRDLRRLLAGSGVDVVHFHNTFPLVSPAAYYAARAEGAAVVQTLHNFRLLCANANLFRDGHPCEQCVGRTVAWPGVVHGCYRGSRAASAVTGAMLAAHRAAGTWSRAVDLYIALSEFARGKFLTHGLPADRVLVKPNFVAADPGAGRHDGRFALYAGRLTTEKGVETLLAAWARLGPGYALRVAGDGPLAARAAATAGVEWLGQQSKAEVIAAMQAATVLVFPSEWYEPFGLTLVEALATGLPVIASARGAAPEIIEDGVSGRIVPPGDPDALAAAVAWAFENPGALATMGAHARGAYAARYGAARGYEDLMAVYRVATARAAAQRS
ncbi:glycosyl transferase [Gemmatimonadetes bacterium T265]|nr:glycosyl transferase [Gemmatimonadetes bacterium T265]